MTDLSASLNGKPVESCVVWVSNVGAWQADVDMAEADAPTSGQVTIAIGTLTLKGTIATEYSGVHVGRASLKILAGGAAWRREVFARSYHNDAGVKAQLVAEDAAREAGEVLGSFVPTLDRMGTDYVRDRGKASVALEAAAGGASWWVDYDGVTHVGPRAEFALPATAYHVSSFDPRSRTATLGTTDPGAVLIGGIVTEHLDQPGVIREMVITADEEGLRIKAWLGTSDTMGKLASLFRDLARRATEDRLTGLYRYRVVHVAVDKRLDLQVVRKQTGLPDLTTVAVMPGVPGAYPEPTPGCEVLVAFIDGDKTQPIVTHFGGSDRPGFVPVALTLGGSSGAPAARQGDTVDVLLPPVVPFVGTLTPPGSSIAGTLTFTTPKTIGIISGGSTKVKVAP
jgi:hypothetical protein